VLVFYAASLMLGAKAVAVVGSSGRLSHWSKVLLLAIAVLFSACFAMVRLATGFSWAAVTVSGIEFALLSSYALMLIAIAGVMRRSAESRDAHRAAGQLVAVEEERAARLRDELERVEQEAEAMRLAVAQREDDQRRLPLYEDLARSTVEAEALFTTAELISKAAKAAYGEPLPADEKSASENGGAQ
jgi:hypothetical protein